MGKNTPTLPSAPPAIRNTYYRYLLKGGLLNILDLDIDQVFLSRAHWSRRWPNRPRWDPWEWCPAVRRCVSCVFYKREKKKQTNKMCFVFLFTLFVVCFPCFSLHVFFFVYFSTQCKTEVQWDRESGKRSFRWAWARNHLPRHTLQETK